MGAAHAIVLLFGLHCTFGRSTGVGLHTFRLRHRKSKATQEEVPERAGGTEIILGVHHETGSDLMEGAVGCFGKFVPTSVSYIRNLTTAEIENKKVIHLVRNPVSIVVSSYLHHKLGTKDFAKKPGTAEIVAANHAHLQSLVRTNETYQSFLERLSMMDGLKLELARTIKPSVPEGGPLKDLGDDSRRCRRHPDSCMEVCLEDFVPSAQSYTHAWGKILRFLGMNSTQQEKTMYNCLSHVDLHRPQVQAFVKEAILNVDVQQLAFMQRKVIDIDAEFFDGTLAKMAHGHFECGADLQDLRDLRPGGEHPSDGARLKRWRIEDAWAR